MNSMKRAGSYLENIWLWPVVMMTAVVLGSGYMLGINYIEKVVVAGLVAVRDAAPSSQLAVDEPSGTASRRVAASNDSEEGTGSSDEPESVYVDSAEDLSRRGASPIQAPAYESGSSSPQPDSQSTTPARCDVDC